MNSIIYDGTVTICFIFNSKRFMPHYTLTSQAKKNIMEMKNTNPRQDGKLSVARYIINTHPSCDAASYTVKKLVAKNKIRWLFL